MQNKIKITQQEFDDIYDIENPIKPEITGETMASPDKKTADQEIPKEDTTPFLSEEEQEQEDSFKESLNWNEEE